MSAHILYLGTLSTVSVMIKMLCYEEETILLAKQIMFFCFFKTLDVHVKIKLCKSYCSSMYSSVLWSLENDVLQDFCCSWRSALRRSVNLPYNTHCFLLPILTGTLPVFDELCKNVQYVLIIHVFIRVIVSFMYCTAQHCSW